MRPWLELARISNLPTVWSNVVAAWLLAGGGWGEVRLGWLLLGGSLIYTAGMILNDVCDVAFDRRHRPERPIPRGAVTRGQAAGMGALMLGGGGVLMVSHGGAQMGMTLGLMAVVLAYDLYHKPFAGSVWLMGACRTLLYLSAASAVVGDTGLVRWPAVVIGGYVVGLSLLARREMPGAEAGVKWLPQLLLMAPVVVALTQLEGGHKVVVLVLAVGLLVWVRRAVGWLQSNPPATIGPAVGRLLAGIVWVDALAIAPQHPWVALGMVVLVPVLLLWQRVIAAT